MKNPENPEISDRDLFFRDNLKFNTKQKKLIRCLKSGKITWISRWLKFGIFIPRIFTKFPGFMQIFSGFFIFGMSREFFKSNLNQKFFNTIPDFRLFTIFFSKICKKSRIRFSKPVLFILIREPRDHKFVDNIWIEFPSRCNFPRNKNRVGRYVARCWILNGIYFVESWVTFVEF